MKSTKQVGKVLHYTMMSGLAALFLFPILVTITNSFMSSFEIFNRYTDNVTPANAFGSASNVHYVELTLVPGFVTLRQYLKLFFGDWVYLGLFWNSVKIVLPVVLGHLLVSAPAAYAFAFSRLKGKEVLFVIYIVVMMLPLQVSLVPNYIMAEMLHLEESYWAIILPGIFNPFGVFLIRQFLNGVPIEYIEAAKMDGAGYVRIIVSIILPMIKSAITALAILTFIEYWNVVDQAVIFLPDSTREPLSVYLSRLSEQSWDMIFAVSCFYMFPALLIFLYGQENMIEGLQLSGIK